MKPTKPVFLKVKDFSVSHENFDLIYDSDYDLLKTTPQPKIHQLSNYYKSEDYISHTNAKRNLFERLYHVVRGYALNKKLKLINGLSPQQKSVLDIGCGTGDFLNTAYKHSWDVLGVEPNKKARTIAASKFKNGATKILDIDALQHIKPNTFDVITLWHVLEHLPNLDAHFNIFSKLLKPNGHLVIAVPNYKSFDARHYKQFWAAFDVPRHLWHFSQKSILKISKQHNFKLVDTKPMLFDAFYVSMLSEKYKANRFGFLRGFCVGLWSNFKAIRSGEYSSLIYCLKNLKN